MSKARTVPGENLSSRLAARSGRRVRAGARPSFYQRLGVPDPFEDEPEVEEMSRNGMFSYISASNYYRAIRSQRFRMMWRLQAIRHRPVTGERLRSAGPKFTQSKVLANADLPSLDELVLLDPEAQAEQREDKKGRIAALGEVAATRAVERSVDRPDVELTRALAQIETLLQSQSREPESQRVREIIRDVPNMAPSKRAEVVREVVRTVERRPEEASAIQERPVSPVAGATRSARRPAAVAANRIQTVAPSERTYEGIQRRLAPIVEQGPAGLQPVLRTSPAIQAVSESAVARIARRDEAVPAPQARPARVTRTSRLRPTETIALSHVQEEEEGIEQAIRPTRAAPAAWPEPRVATEAPVETPRIRERATAKSTHQAPSVTASRPRSARSVPTSRVAEALVARTLVAPEEGSRGLAATGRVAKRPVGEAVPRAVVRARAGSTEADVRAPLASSATSWLSDALHEDRRVIRARRAAAPAVRSLIVAQDLPLLDPTVEPGDEPAPRRAVEAAPAAPVATSKPVADDVVAPVAERIARRAEAPVAPAPEAPARADSDTSGVVVPRTRRLAQDVTADAELSDVPSPVRRLTAPPTLRAAARAIVDTESLAPAPVRPVSRAVSAVIPSASRSLLDPAARETDEGSPVVRRAEERAPVAPTPVSTKDAAPAPTPVVPVRAARSMSESAQVAPTASRPRAERPTVRVARRARQVDEAKADEPFAPIVRRAAPENLERPVRMRSAEVRSDHASRSHRPDRPQPGRGRRGCRGCRAPQPRRPGGVSGLDRSGPGTSEHDRRGVAAPRAACAGIRAHGRGYACRAWAASCGTHRATAHARGFR